MSTKERQSIRYQPPLDGIRAIAILGVLIFHISPSFLKGGFTGVDVFFVLSGFLITSIILNASIEESFSLREFYLKRILRLLPNTILMVCVVVILWSLCFKSMARSVGNHALWALFSGSNLFIWKTLGGYWGDSAEWSPLTHTWSLGIEEQFYLFYPVVLVQLYYHKSIKLELYLILGAVLSFAICAYGTYAHPVATFYLLPTRVWELLLGAVFAAHRINYFGCNLPMPPSLLTKFSGVLGLLGFGAILFGFVFIGGGTLFPGWVCLIPSIGTLLLIIGVVDSNTILSRLLSLPLFVRIGKLSFSLYLWHWPFITFGKIQSEIYQFPQIFGALAGGGGGIFFGCVAYYLIEKPFRSTTWSRFWRLLVTAVGFATVVFYSNSVASRHLVADPLHRFDTTAFSGRLYDSRGNNVVDNLSNTVRYYDVYIPEAPSIANDSWRNGGIVHLYGADHPEVVVLGSSHALMYSKLIDELCREMKMSVAFFGVDGGGPAFYETMVEPNFKGPFTSTLEAREFDETRRRYIRDWKPNIVFVIDRWDYLNNTTRDIEIRLKGFMNEVATTVGRIVFVTQVPVHRGGDQVNLREIVSARMGDGNKMPRLSPDSKEQFRRQLATKVESLKAEYHNLYVLRADLAFYHKDGSIRYAEGRKFFYADDDHLSDYGSEVVRDLFRDSLRCCQ